MAESEAVHPQEDVKDDDTDAPGYKPPEFKPLEDMLNQDADDESLVKYKQALLGGGGDATDPCMYLLKLHQICFLSGGHSLGIAKEYRPFADWLPDSYM